MSSCDEPELNSASMTDFASVVQPDPLYQDLLREIEQLRAENQRLWEIIEERFPGADEREPPPASNNGLAQVTASPYSHRSPSANCTSRQLPPAAGQSDVGPTESIEAATKDPAAYESQPAAVVGDDTNRQQEQLEQTLLEFGAELARLREELGAYIESQEVTAAWYQYGVPVDVSESRTRAGVSPRQIVRGLIWFSVLLTILLIALLSYEVASTANLF